MLTSKDQHNIKWDKRFDEAVQQYRSKPKVDSDYESGLEKRLADLEHIVRNLDKKLNDAAD